MLDIRARQIFDSRGNPTVEAEVCTECGVFRASVPSGASVGSREAIEKRDGGDNFRGLAVTHAVSSVATEIRDSLLSSKHALTDQKAIDLELIKLDGTKNKSRLGSNSTLSVSLAVARAGAASRGAPLYSHISFLSSSRLGMPRPSFNVINGGKHAGNDMAVQEIMLVPTKSTTFAESMRVGVETFAALKDVLREAYGQTATNVGDEGGFAPPIDDAGRACELLMKAAQRAGYGDAVGIALDAAASEFYANGVYTLDANRVFSPISMMEYYEKLMEKFPIISIEDPFDENDLDSWRIFTSRNGSKVQIVGDDLLVSNTGRIGEAISGSWCNALLLKPNQVGTLTEAIDAAKKAMAAGWNVMVSHRSGETSDSFIADLAVGIGSKYIKSGGLSRGERIEKYNQLLRIEEETGWTLRMK